MGLSYKLGSELIYNLAFNVLFEYQRGKTEDTKYVPLNVEV